MYSFGANAQKGDPMRKILDTPLHGSGVLPIGRYEDLLITKVTTRGKSILITLTTPTGEAQEVAFPWDYQVGEISMHAADLLARLLPHLECIKRVANNPTLLEGLKMTATLEWSEGYLVCAEGQGRYSAIDAQSGDYIVKNKFKIRAVRKACADKGLKAARPRLNEICGGKWWEQNIRVLNDTISTSSQAEQQSKEAGHDPAESSADGHTGQAAPRRRARYRPRDQRPESVHRSHYWNRLGKSIKRGISGRKKPEPGDGE